MQQERLLLLKNLYKNGAFFTDLRKAEGALKDIFPDMPKLANTLLLALKIGVLKDLNSNESTLPVEVVLPNITTRLVQEYGLRQEDAMEAVGIWAVVCEKATEEQIATISRRFSSKEASATISPQTRSSLVNYITSEDTRECPFCAETIKKKANVCKHCKSNVEMMECPFCAEEIIKEQDVCAYCDCSIKTFKNRKEGVAKVYSKKQSAKTILSALDILNCDDPDVFEIEQFLNKDGRIEVIKESAGKGETQAQFWVAYCHYEGLAGFKKNHNDAFRQFLISGSKGNCDSQYYAGLCFVFGKGADENKLEAVKWFAKAADQEHSMAQFWLGALLLELEEYKESVKWLTLSAENGNYFAQNNLGFCYQNGCGVAFDMKEAIKWYTLAADQNLDKAQVNLGKIYYDLLKDYPEAVKWFDLASKQGDAVAQLYLGRCYEQGAGLKKDKEKALHFYGLSAAQGLDEATTALNELKKSTDTFFIDKT
jgi:TPR repeat protein